MTYRPSIIGLARSATSLARAAATPIPQPPGKKRVRPLPDAVVAEIKRDLKYLPRHVVANAWASQGVTYAQVVLIDDEISYRDVKAAP